MYININHVKIEVFIIIRVVSGEKKGFLLKTSKKLNIKPTLSRVKENIFNILREKIPNSIGLDLFAGYGSIAIEALSRNASKVILVEKNKKAVYFIKKNLEKTNYLEKTKIFNCSWDVFLNKNKFFFDWIYVDPPYFLNNYCDIINGIVKKKCLKDDGILIVETFKNKEIFKKNLDFYCYKKVLYGNILICFFKKI